jgi:hypothetical protein
MDRNLTPESSNTSNDLNLNLNDKKIIKQLISPLKEILFNTLIVFESIFFIYEQRLADLNNCSELELKNLKMLVDKSFKFLHQSEHFVSYRKFNTESHLLVPS